MNSLTVEWRIFTELASIVPEWRKLAACALEPNVFYEPAFALAAAPAFAPDAGALLVWSATSPRRLLGFFPARVEKRRYGFNLPLLIGLTHPYGPLGVPLVEREAAEPVIAAWLAHLAADVALPGLALLPFLTENGAFATALEPILRRAQMPFADFDRHQRALLAPTGERSLYVEHALSHHRRKELRRQWRRLSEAGAVVLSAAADAAAVGAAIDHFLALEAAGWKGRVGTAAADDQNLQRFVRKAVSGLAAEGKVTIDRLFVDGCAIAAAIVLRSGRSAWFWKIAYDEAFARFSPGVMLSVALTEELVADVSVVRADFLRDRRSSDDRSHLARALAALQPADRCASASAVFDCAASGSFAVRSYRRRQERARAHASTRPLEHDPEKWKPVFATDHAQNKGSGARSRMWKALCRKDHAPQDTSTLRCSRVRVLLTPDNVFVRSFS